MAKHIVKCMYCEKPFDTNSEEFVKPDSGRRYAHKQCYDDFLNDKNKELKDKFALEAYIKQLFHSDFIDPFIQRQIKSYIEKDHYTYSGILKSLIYFYDVKKNDITKANGRISIVKWIYNEAYNYYKLIWENNQRNDVKVIKQFEPKEVVVVIKQPIPKPKTKKKFIFFDEE